jgi:glycerol uptake facilitator protein
MPWLGAEHETLPMVGHAASWVKEAAFEFAGTFWFVWASLMNVSTSALYNVGMGWEGLAVSWGFNLFVGIQIASIHSRAFLNPCVAWAKWIDSRDDLNFAGFVIYSLVEVVAAFAAAAAVYVLNYGNAVLPSLEGDGACNLYATHRSVNLASALSVELFGTMLLVLGIEAICRSNTLKEIFTKKEAHATMQAALIGAWLTSLILIMGAQTAFSFNTARDMGPRLFATAVYSGGAVDCFKVEYSLPLMVADFAGATLGMLVSRIATN